jgi:uncharacterized delta-60 repeat protein
MGRRGQASIWLGALCAALVLLLGLAGSAAAATRTMAVQADGKIVVAGFTPLGSGYLARLEPDGRLDPGFGTGGVVVDHRIGAIATLALPVDGRILAGYDGGVARYEGDGSVDPSFGNGGLSAFWPAGRPAALLALPDGRIVVGGSEISKLGPSFGHVVVLAGDGRSREWAGTISMAIVSDLLARADGSMLVAGLEAYGPKGFLARVVPGSSDEYDRGFGVGVGRVPLALSGSGTPLSPTALAAVPGGALVAGSVGYAGGQLGLARFDDDGAVDKSFGSDGFAMLGSDPQALTGVGGMAVRGDGKIVVLGEDHGPAGAPGAPGEGACPGCRSPLVARFLANGALDSGFGQGGTARLPGVGGPQRGAGGEDLALLPDDRVLVGGRATDGSSGMVLGRLQPDGRVDPSFGTGGVTEVDPCAGGEEEQRLVGCLPSAWANLRLRNSAKGRSLHLRVRPAGDWARIASLRLQLPRSLRLRRGMAGHVRVIFIDAADEPQRGHVRGGGHRLDFGVAGLGADAITLDIPRGALQPVHRLRPAARAAFRVRVGFQVLHANGGQQTLVLRRAL